MGTSPHDLSSAGTTYLSGPPPHGYTVGSVHRIPIRTRLGMFSSGHPRRPPLFKGRRVEAEIIVLCVRSHMQYRLSLQRWRHHDGVHHVTILRSIGGTGGTQPTPPTGTPTIRSWRVDETYCQVAGKWATLYIGRYLHRRKLDFLVR